MVAVGAVPKEDVNVYMLLELNQEIFLRPKDGPERIDMGVERLGLGYRGVIQPRIVLVRIRAWVPPVAATVRMGGFYAKSLS